MIEALSFRMMVIEQMRMLESKEQNPAEVIEKKPTV